MLVKIMFLHTTLFSGTFCTLFSFLTTLASQLDDLWPLFVLFESENQSQLKLRSYEVLTIEPKNAA